MTIYVIRHGEKLQTMEINPALGHTDPALSPRGEEQAESLLRFFEGRDVRRIIASGYLRARQTAAPLSASRGLPVETDARLNEIDNGIVETMPDLEVAERYPDFWKDFTSHEKDCRFPGGETGEEAKMRQDSLLEELKRGGGNAALFTHEGYARLLMCNLLSLPVYHRHKFKYDFCGITEITLTGYGWRIIRFNHVSWT